MMHYKLFRTFVGLTLAVLLIGCTSSARTSVPPMPSIPVSTQVPPGSSNPTPAAEKVSSYQECLRAAGSFLQENYDPPQCVTESGKIFQDKGGASTETIGPTVTTNESGMGAPASPLSPQGPWLLYLHNMPREAMYDVPDVPPELILLNQDGSGRTPLRMSGCFPGSSQLGSATYLAKVESGLYLVQPLDGVAMIVDEIWLYSTCPTSFHGDEKGGMLVSLDAAAEKAQPELIVYELPAGKIRDRLPVVQCSTDQNTCDEARSMWTEMQSVIRRWSPNGRYLAYAALVDDSTDLFVYDSQERTVRRLTHGPDWVGPIEWSPDGTQIIMQELLNEDLINYGPISAVPSSVWAVSITGNEIRQLYQIDSQYGWQMIWRWLDDQRFIAFEGSMDPTEGSLRPRLVDLKAGTDQLLFDDWFNMISFDPVHETLALMKQPSEKSPQGIFVISIKDGTRRSVGDGSYLTDIQKWDSQSGLFVSSFPCQEDPQRLQAFDYQGNFHCVSQPVPTPSPSLADEFPAPDGKHSLAVKDGLWLAGEGQAEIQISPDDPSDVTWCPDSTCFFFSIPQAGGTWTLYHVSLPGLEVSQVDEGIQSPGSYQWLGDEK